MEDLLIRGGQVIDGSGTPARPGGRCHQKRTHHRRGETVNTWRHNGRSMPRGRSSLLVSSISIPTPISPSL